jgi:hypothetical protein
MEDKKGRPIDAVQIKSYRKKEIRNALNLYIACLVSRNQSTLLLAPVIPAYELYD